MDQSFFYGRDGRHKGRGEERLAEEGGAQSNFGLCGQILFRLTALIHKEGKKGRHGEFRLGSDAESGRKNGQGPARF